MKIVVLVKQTPDTAELPKVSAAEVQSGQVKATLVINPWDEYAAEEAILLAERFGGDSVAITLGPAGAADALKHALAMGVGSAKIVDSSAAQGGDLWTTAAALAAAVKAEGGADVILTGQQSVDANSGAVFVGVARTLGCPLFTGVAKVVDIAGGKITVERLIEGGRETVTASLPVVLSVTKEINDPRYPSFMGIRKANRAQIPTLTPAELGLAAPQAQTQWTHIRKPAERKTEVHIIGGDTVQQKAKALADALLAEKVI